LEAHEQNMTTLLSGIAKDAQKLLEQQLAMAKVEIAAEYEKAKTVAVSFAIGASLVSVAAFLIAFGIAHWISWAFPTVPLWVSYVVLAIVMAAVGAGLLYYGKEKAEQIKLTPERTLETVKEMTQ
jgi:hypothetical protein